MTRLWIACAFLSLGCATAATRERDARWSSEWNARVEAASTLWGSPCGDPEFDPWADEFLAACHAKRAVSGEDETCSDRRRWVWARSRQCGKWQDYLLRNHHRQERSDRGSEPPTRVD